MLLKKIFSLRDILILILTISIVFLGVKYSKKYYNNYLNNSLKYKVIPEYYTSKANFKESQDSEILIPKIIHRIWFVFDPDNPELPEVYKKFDRKLKDLHPDYEIKEWNDKSIDDFIKKYYPNFWPIYNSYDMPVKKHDAARYFLLDHYGGIFIQHSLLFQKSIDNLLKGNELLLSEHDSSLKHLFNGFMASIPGHPFMKYVISILPERVDKHPVRSTGPALLAYLFDKYYSDKDMDKVSVLDNYYIVPFSWREKAKEPFLSYCLKNTEGKCFELFGESYSYTLWSASWLPQVKK